MEHTPGPWETAASISGEPFVVRTRKNFYAIAYVNGRHAHHLKCEISPEQSAANARLIADAPEMRKRLEKIRKKMLQVLEMDMRLSRGEVEQLIETTIIRHE